jgi:hypothetical protein
MMWESRGKFLMPYKRPLLLNKLFPNMASWGTELRHEVEAGVEVWNWPLEFDSKAQLAVTSTSTPIPQNFLI